MDYCLTSQPQSFGQPAEYDFEEDDEWASARTDFVPNSQPGQRLSLMFAGQGQSRGFSNGLHSSQGVPQSLHFPHYSPASGDQEHSFGLPQPLGLESDSTDFSMDLPQSGHYSFENGSTQIYAQQSCPSAPNPPKDSDLSGPESSQNGWYQASLNAFQLRTCGLDGNVMDTPSIETAYGQGPLNVLSGCNTAISTTTNSHGDYLTPASRSQNSSSKSLKSVTEISSPTSDFTARRGLAVSDQFCPVPGAHVCRWRLDGDHICGRRFGDNVSLHSHVAEAHVNALEATEDQGFICRWKGCDRLMNKKRQSKRGFDTKSKMRRHIEVHTGPRESCPCTAPSLGLP